ncbi:hypothetical protein ACWEOE_27635 [Amycolatopsis sp. NPDC004368]
MVAYGCGRLAQLVLNRSLGRVGDQPVLRVAGDGRLGLPTLRHPQPQPVLDLVVARATSAPTNPSSGSSGSAPPAPTPATAAVRVTCATTRVTGLKQHLEAHVAPVPRWTADGPAIPMPVTPAKAPTASPQEH